MYSEMQKTLSENAQNAGEPAEKPVEESGFSWKELFRALSNPRFIMLALLCVFFYCCIISFKKFGTAIVIPRFGMDIDSAKWVISLIPFFTVVFTPLFGALVDKLGKATLWMITGSTLVLAAHLVIAFAPNGTPFFGYAGIAMLGIGYSLVPSAMWPTVPKIVPERNLSSAYALIYWVQNMGMLLVPIIVGEIFTKTLAGGDTEALKLQAAVKAEYVFVALGVLAVIVAFMIARSSSRHPELAMDEASAK